jgi:peptidyl-prolyl cis-trans isomerase D
MIRFLQTPGPVKKMVLGGLLLFICIMMVVTLIPGGLASNFGFGEPPKGVLATVAGDEITMQEVQRQAESLARQQFPRGGALLGQFMPYFRRQAADSLISQKAVLSEAERLGLRVDDAELADELQHGNLSQYLFPGGKFVGQDQYENFVASNFQTTVPEFERREKEFLLIQKLVNLVSGAVTVPDSEVMQEARRRNTKVKFEYAVLSTDEIRKTIHPAEAELRAFYERNKAAYANAIPEKRKVAYVVIETAKVRQQTPVTHDELQAYYNQHRDEYRVPEQVNLRQIVIKKPVAGADGKVDQKALEAAKAKAEEVRKLLKSGTDFAKLAQKYSDDPSGKTGGALGWVQRLRIPDPEVQKAAFALPKGGTSDLIEGNYQYVAVHVDDKQEAHVKTLEEVRPQIEPLLAQDKAARAAEAQAAALERQAHSDGLEKAAAARGLSVTTTDFVSRNDALPGVGTSPEFAGAVFSAQEKAPPELVRFPQGFAVFQVLAIKPPATPTFEEIKDRVENEFKNERASMMLGQKTAELSDRARAQHDLKKAARELGATLKTSEFVGPDGQVPDIGSMAGPASVAFSMQPGAISGPISGGANGVVIHLLERQEPSAEALAKDKEEVRESLLRGKRDDWFRLFVANLRQSMQKQGKIRINEEEMKTLTAGGSVEGF